MADKPDTFLGLVEEYGRECAREAAGYGHDSHVMLSEIERRWDAAKAVPLEQLACLPRRCLEILDGNP
jgi:hypothetical protein